MKIQNDNHVMCFDGIVPMSDENAVQLFVYKSDLDYIPPVIVSSELLSDFGKELFGIDGMVVKT